MISESIDYFFNIKIENDKIVIDINDHELFDYFEDILIEKYNIVYDLYDNSKKKFIG